MKIYTKNGDQGQTMLVDGSAIAKSDTRLKTYGTVDELNSHLGLLIAMLKELAIFDNEKEMPLLKDLQIWLFQLGSQLACADPKVASQLPTVTQDSITRLEAQMDLWDQELPSLKNFILPGGHAASAQAHVCRTVARRAERACVVLHEQAPLDFLAIPFLNRMSDYFFVLARVINLRLKIESIEWVP